MKSLLKIKKRSWIKMMFVLLGFIYSESEIVAKPNKKKVNPPKKVKVEDYSLEKNHFNSTFERAKQDYRSRKIDDSGLWKRTLTLRELTDHVHPNGRAELVQLQSHLLMRAGYPIAASLYATRALSLATTPYAKDFSPAWEVLRSTSKVRPIQEILITLAKEKEMQKNTSEQFGRDWYYFIGTHYERNHQTELAIENFNKLQIRDRYFIPSQYQKGMIYYDSNKLEKAMESFNNILYPTSEELSSLEAETKEDIKNYTYLALARIFYQEKDFKKSIYNYRQVSRNSFLFYDALFEQSWALFMGGYPNHALGALYSVDSPFFKNEFNPEASLLRSISYYWMCHYDNARLALNEFIHKHAEGVEKLEKFLDRKRLNSQTAYTLFENLESGISESALGIPRNILETAANKDSMLLYKEQLSFVDEELSKIKKDGIYGSRVGDAEAISLLTKWNQSLKNSLGETYLSELKDLRENYDRLNSQAQFLSLELLMSEKEKILGRELHAASKITSVSSLKNIRGWAKQGQSWATDDKNEYWWDEIGFYIYDVKPECQASH